MVSVYWKVGLDVYGAVFYWYDVVFARSANGLDVCQVWLVLMWFVI